MWLPIALRNCPNWIIFFCCCFFVHTGKIKQYFAVFFFFFCWKAPIFDRSILVLFVLPNKNNPTSMRFGVLVAFFREFFFNQPHFFLFFASLLRVWKAFFCVRFWFASFQNLFDWGFFFFVCVFWAFFLTNPSEAKVCETPPIPISLDSPNVSTAPPCVIFKRRFAALIVIASGRFKANIKLTGGVSDAARTRGLNSTFSPKFWRKKLKKLAGPKK